MEVLSVAVVGLMAGAAVLWRLPATQCDQCEHCRTERQEAQRRHQEEWHRKMHSWYGKEHCPICRQDG